MKTTIATYLVACQSFILATSALALPPTPRDGTSTSKRILLWDYTNTGNVSSVPTLKSSLDEAASKVTAVSNWDTWRPSEAPDSLAFYPTVRTIDMVSGDSWTQLLASLDKEKSAGRQTIVQYLNEPENEGVSASDAATTWRSSLLPLKTKYNAKLVGPGTSSSDAGIAFQDAFMGALADDEKPDYVGLHYYSTEGNPVAGEIAWGQNYLTKAHSKYNLPVFVNEIACTSRDSADVKQFSDEMTTWMEQQDWIQQYGFFGVSLQVANSWVSPEAQLLDTSGAWTTLGKDLMGL
ncbi:hypothetical protein N0V93_004536 [Gnomoniopsis smithogilvyi]|uniref:Asl1-like glycosyl hydrolase catalytic domain-containing protein n=1 Tax=Gnomoniopsis smithogilvyi TaxID=1191159 RepID=A0A9W8YRA2_9PEZI|nr:hypothetical protein N0V93_004536 [Gnomoniopsis smithogilvyi]